MRRQRMKTGLIAAANVWTALMGGSHVAGQTCPGGVQAVPVNTGCRTALRVTFADLPSPFEGFIGQTMWVGAPFEVSELAGADDATPPTFVAARLSCEPFFTDWGALGLVHVIDSAIVPGGVYEVQALDELADPGLEASYSAPLAVASSGWGDLLGDCSVTPCSPPDGDADFDDIVGVVDKFRNLPGAPIKARVDVAPSVPDQLVDFTDIPAIVDAFRLLPYPYDGPTACP